MNARTDEKHPPIWYVTRGCRCGQCTEWNRARIAGFREKRRDARIEIDGRLVAPGPARQHGRAATYSNHGCRCEPCTEANRRATRLHVSNKRARDRARGEGAA